MLGLLFIALVISFVAAYAVFVYTHTRQVSVGKVVRNGKFKGKSLPANVFDCVIVGAGPSGSTMAHYVAKVSIVLIVVSTVICLTMYNNSQEVKSLYWKRKPFHETNIAAMLCALLRFKSSLIWA